MQVRREGQQARTICPAIQYDLSFNTIHSFIPFTCSERFSPPISWSSLVHLHLDQISIFSQSCIDSSGQSVNAEQCLVHLRAMHGQKSIECLCSFFEQLNEYQQIGSCSYQHITSPPCTVLSLWDVARLCEHSWGVGNNRPVLFGLTVNSNAMSSVDMRNKNLVQFRRPLVKLWCCNCCTKTLQSVM